MILNNKKIPTQTVSGEKEMTNSVINESIVKNTNEVKNGGFPMISQKSIDRVIEEADFEEILEYYGFEINNGETLCPFHNDTNPSLKVDINKGLFHCFACGTGGNVIQFVQKYEGKLGNKVDFFSAIKKIAKIQKIPLVYENMSKEQKEEMEVKNNLNELKIKLKSYFIDNFWGELGQTAREKMIKRGFTEEMLKEYEVGYADDNCMEFIKNNCGVLTEEQLLKARIIEKSDNGFVYFPLYNRIIFNIEKGTNVVGFQGRSLEENPQRKYLTYSDFPIWNFNAIRKYAKKYNGVINVCEGIPDALTLIQNGHPNTIAILGTETLGKFIDILLNIKEVKIFVLWLDNDNAGKKAVEKYAKIFKSKGVIVPFDYVPHMQLTSAKKDLNDLRKDLESGELKNLSKEQKEHQLKIFEDIIKQIEKDSKDLNGIFKLMKFNEEEFKSFIEENQNKQIDYFQLKLTEWSKIEDEVTKRKELTNLIRIAYEFFEGDEGLLDVVREKLKKEYKIKFSVFDSKLNEVKDEITEEKQKIKKETDEFEDREVDIEIIDNCYFKFEIDSYRKLSSFIMELEEVIYDKIDEEVYYVVNFKNNFYSERKTFNSKMINNKNDFMSLLTHPSFTFEGSQNDLQKIKLILSEHEYIVSESVECIGLHEKDGERFFISHETAINENLEIKNNLKVSEKRKSIKTDILQHEEITKEELLKLSPHLFHFNELNITSSLISSLPLFLLKPLLVNANIKVQHLLFIGEAGSGKSTTLERILMPFFSIHPKDVVNCNSISQFTLYKKMSSSNTIPAILEEYKPFKMKDYQIKLISETLRSGYDGHSGERGTSTQKVNQYPLTSPVVLVGEEGQDETAIKERSIILNFSKEGRKGKENSFEFLTKNTQLIQKLGRTILNRILKLDIENLLLKREKFMEELIEERITEDRVKNSVANLLLGLSIIEDLYSEFNLNFEKTAKIKKDDLIKAMNENVYIEILDENTTTKSIIDNTIELINTMKEVGYLTFNQDYTLINNDSELALNMPSLYPKITKFVRDFNINTEIITSQNQFTKQLRKTTYYMDYKSVKYSGHDKPKKSYVLNVAKIEEKNIDISSLLNNELEIDEFDNIDI